MKNKEKPLSKSEVIVITDFLQIFIKEKLNICYYENNKNETKVLNKDTNEVIFTIKSNILKKIVESIEITNVKNVFYRKNNFKGLKSLLNIDNFKVFNLNCCKEYYNYPLDYIVYRNNSINYIRQTRDIKKTSFSNEYIENKVDNLDCRNFYNFIKNMYIDFLNRNDIDFLDCFANINIENNLINTFITNMRNDYDLFLYYHLNLKRYLTFYEKNIYKEIDSLFSFLKEPNNNYIIYDDNFYIFNYNKKQIIPFSLNIIKEYIMEFNKNIDNLNTLIDIKEYLLNNDFIFRDSISLNFYINESNDIYFRIKDFKSTNYIVRTEKEAYIEPIGDIHFKFNKNQFDDCAKIIKKELQKQLEIKNSAINVADEETKTKENVIEVFKELFPFMNIIKEKEAYYSDKIKISVLYNKRLEISFDFLDDIYLNYKMILKGYKNIDNCFIKSKLLPRLYKKSLNYSEDEIMFLKIIKNDVLYFQTDNVLKINKQVINYIYEQIIENKNELIKSFNKLNIDIDDALYLIRKLNIQKSSYSFNTFYKLLKDEDNLKIYIENLLKNNSTNISYKILENDKVIASIIKNNFLEDINNICFKFIDEHIKNINVKNIRLYIDTLKEIDILFNEYIENTFITKKYSDIEDIYYVVIKKDGLFKFKTNINTLNSFIQDFNNYIEENYKSNLNDFIVQYKNNDLKKYIEQYKTNILKKYNSLEICMSNPVLMVIFIQKTLLEKEIKFKNANKFLISLLKNIYQLKFNNWEKEFNEILFEYKNTPSFINDVMEVQEYNQKLYNICFKINENYATGHKDIIIANLLNHFKNIKINTKQIDINNSNITNLYDLYILKEFTFNNVIDIKSISKEKLNNINILDELTKLLNEIVENNNNNNFLNSIIINKNNILFSKEDKELINIYKLMYSEKEFISSIKG